MTYQEWAKEYRNSAETIRTKIQQLREEEKHAPVSELPLLDRKISLLYGMYLDCSKTADLLQKREGVV